MSLLNLLESKKRIMMLLSLAAIISFSILVQPSINENRAFAHGDAPTSCENVYDAAIISMTIDNGVETFDPIADPDLHFDANIDNGYTVTFTLHAAGQRYTDGSNIPGSTWYRTTAPGFANGVCVDDVEANSLKTVTTQISAPGGIPDDYNYPRIEWGTISDGDQIIYSMTWQQEPLATTADEESELTVRTEDGHTGSEISGYYTVISKDGSVLETGFSPAFFTLNNDEGYVVQVQDYGPYVFDHWQDSGSTIRDRSISISSDTSITAVYRNVNSPPLEQPPDEELPPEEEPPLPPGEGSTVTIRSIDRNSGNEITGYYTALFDNSGNVIETGFTPATFDVTGGQEYTVEVQDYGSYYFNYWHDNGDTDRSRTFAATDSAQIMTAAYGTSQNAVPPEEDNSNGEEQSPQQTTGTISVATVDSSGNQIYGYYTTLSQNDNVIQTGFSPAEFTVSSGQTYQVAVADYGQYVFDHWLDGSTGRFHDAETGDSLVAVYRP